MKHITEYLAEAAPVPSEPRISFCVEWIVTMKHNKAYCAKCIDFWRDLYGESFADKVAREVGKEFRRRKSPSPLDAQSLV